MRFGKTRWFVVAALIAPVFALPLHAHRFHPYFHPHQTAQDAKRAAKDAVKAFFPTGSKAAAPHSKLLANLDDPRITESSGLAPSHRSPGFLFTHNDSGDGPFVFAIDRAGHTKARYKLQNAENIDWEDIAVGPSATSGRTAIYVGDIGNNNLPTRTVMTIYRVDEPNVAAIKGTLKDDQSLGGVETFRYRYPDGNHDCETLMVHPKTGEVVLVSKEGSGLSGIYSLPNPLRKGEVMLAKKIGSLTFRNTFFSGNGLYAKGERMATGGDISPDGKHLIVRTYLKGYQWTLTPGKTIAETMKTPPHEFMLPLTRQGESICYRHDNLTLLMTSEGVHTPLYEMTVP